MAFTMGAALPAFAKHLGTKGNSAAAHAKHDQGSGYTENNDTNDGGTPNNVSDAGDNKHPSGKDRSVENGNSGNQGNASSDPDDNGKGPDRSNGGPDKPNGSGGVDQADQDGNNGCGNDDDFEDDNEGWCGHKPKGDTGGSVGQGNTGDQGDVAPADDHKVTICHATGSSTNPFVQITPSASGVFHGHMGHQDARDIIPPFTYQGTTYSQNWDAAGQALFNAGCEQPAEVVVTPPTCSGDSTMPSGSESDCGEVTPPDEVLGSTDTQGGGIGSPSTNDTVKPGDNVLGLVIHRDTTNVSPSVKAAELAKAAGEASGSRTLPFTGSDIIPLLAVGIGLLITGVATLKLRRNDR
jgi:hypothetical protein